MRINPKPLTDEQSKKNVEALNKIFSKMSPEELRDIGQKIRNLHKSVISDVRNGYCVSRRRSPPSAQTPTAPDTRATPQR